MTSTTETIEIRLDPENPAQFFACCGLFELAAMFGDGVEAAFVYTPEEPRHAEFLLFRAAKSLPEIMGLLKTAKASAEEDSGEAPVTLHFSEGRRITLDWWLKPDHSGKSRYKLWAGQQTTLNSLVNPMLANLPEDADSDLFSKSKKPMSGRFGLDPRSAWNALDFGSSVNVQGRDAYTFPAVEMLAAIGLQGFRPRPGAQRDANIYTLWLTPLPLSVARAAAAGTLRLPSKSFSYSIEKRSGAYSCFAFAHPTQGA